MVVLLKGLSDFAELVVDLWVDLAESVDGLRSPDTCNDVLALCVHEVLTVEVVVSSGRVTCECDTCSRGLTHVSKDHALNVDGCSKKTADVVHLSVLDGSVVVP